MSLSDTAEYWQDVKRNYPYMGPNYYCIKDVDCGHKHHFESEYLNDINCRGCKKLIKENGNIYNLKEGLTPSQKKEERRRKELYKHGECSCGSHLVRRANKKTKEEFLGCSDYPKCKKTKSIK